MEKVLRPGLLIRSVLCALSFLATALTLLNSTADGQVQIQVQAQLQGQANNGEDFQEVWTDRRLIQQSVELAAAVRVPDLPRIREHLWVLKESDQNLLVPDEQNQLWIPVYRFLFREIRTLPEQLRRQLWAEDEPRANAEFTDAVRSGEPRALIAVIQRYPGSDASCRSFLTLARRQLERGHLLAALAWLEPLRNGSADDSWNQTAERTAEEIQQRLSMTVAPEAAAAGVAPERRTWQSRLPVSGQVLENALELRKAANTAQVVLWSNWEPILDDDHIYVRTLRGLLAFNRNDGSVDWMFSGAANFETWLSGSSRNLPSGDILPAELPGAMFSTMEWSRTADLLHRNSVIGQLTQDADQVYVVDDTLDFDNTPQAAFNVRAAPVAPERMPGLTALDKKSGQRQWTVGGPTMEGYFSNTLAGAWFAGPPAAAQGRLFSVVEQAGMLQLLQLDPRNGRVVRKVLLGFPQVSIQTDRARRLRMARPLYSDGLIWTETTTGWLCAVDEASYSLLWVRRMRERTEEQNAALRNQPALMTRPESMASSWKASPPLLFQRNLVTLVSEGRELLCVDCVSGSKRFVRNDLNRAIAIPADQQRLLLIGSDGVTAVSMVDGQSLWNTACPGDRIPAGVGTRDAQQLLVPFSDGAVFAFSIVDGTATLVNDFRSQSGEPSQLLGDSNQLFQFVPWNVHSVVRTGGVDSGASPADVARRLLEERQPAEAWQLIADLTDPLIPDAVQLTELRWRALRLLLSDSPESANNLLLEHLQKTTLTARETAACRILQFEYLQRTAAPAELDDFLLNQLSQHTDLLQQDIGPFVRLLTIENGGAEDRSPVFHQSLRQWTLRHLESRLAQTEPSVETLLQKVLALEDHQLLSIRARSLAKEIHRRLVSLIETRQLNEQALQLLAHYHAIVSDQQPTTTEHQEESEYREGLLKLHALLAQPDAQQGIPADPAHREVSRSLIEAMLLDDDRSRRTDSAISEPSGVWRPRTLEDDAEWTVWKDQPYRIIPISQSVSFRQSEQDLPARSLTDSFINDFDWSLIRVPSALKAVTRVGGESLTWTVPGTFPTSPPTFLGNMAEIQRFHSVLLVQTHLTVTGVSAVDRRVLWMRKVPDGAQGTAAAGFYLRPPFRDPSTGTRLPPGFSRRMNVYLLLPAGPRLAVMLTDQRLEVFDTYTGEELWSLEGAFEHDLLFVCRDALLLFNPRTSDVRTLRMNDGSPTETKITVEQLNGVIGTGGNQLVVWNKGRDTQPNELHWIDFATGDVEHKVQLPVDATLQYLDSETLTAATKDQLSVISFQHRTRRDYRDENGWFAEPDSPADASLPENLLHVMADRYYLYMIRPTSSDRDQIAGMLTGRGPKALSGQLTAIDRSNGRKLWSISTGRATASFEHRTSPVLLLLEVVRPENAAPGAQLLNINGNQMIIRGILKTTGTTLFEHRQSSRYPIPIVEMQTGSDLSVDIEAFGSRARFVPAASVQSNPSFPEN